MHLKIDSENQQGLKDWTPIKNILYNQWKINNYSVLIPELSTCTNVLNLGFSKEAGKCVMKLYTKWFTKQLQSVCCTIPW